MASIESLIWEPPKGEPDAASPSAESFVRLACLDDGLWRPSWAEAAARMLASHPKVARGSIHAAPRRATWPR